MNHESKYRAWVHSTTASVEKPNYVIVHLHEHRDNEDTEVHGEAIDCPDGSRCHEVLLSAGVAKGLSIGELVEVVIELRELPATTLDRIKQGRVHGLGGLVEGKV